MKKEFFNNHGLTIKFKNDTVIISPNSNKMKSVGRIMFIGGCGALLGTLLHAYVNNSNKLNRYCHEK